MKKLIKIFSYLTLSLNMAFFLINPISVNAQEPVTNTEYAEAIQLMLEEGYVILEENEYETVLGIYIPVVTEYTMPEILVQPYAWPGYSAHNFRIQHFSTDFGVVVRTGSLSQGGSQTFGVSYTYTTSVTGSLAIGGKDVNVSLGVSTTSTVSLSDTYQYHCLATRCDIKYYPQYAIYKFDEYFINIYTGTFTAKVLTGFYQSVTIKN
jgi:hypothetical protein